MKYKIIIAAFTIVFFSGCNLLDIDPYSSVPAEDVFTSKKGLDAALNGAYDVLQSASLSQDVTFFGDLAADNLIHVGTKKEYRQISDNLILPDNSYVTALWNNAYDGINRVNNILANIDLVPDISDSEKDLYLGQTHFLRAYFYFDLVKFFGGVPLRLEPVADASPEQLNIGRSSEAEVYTFILDELIEAESLLEGTEQEISAYAGLAAVKALFARIYLYRGDWNNAEIKAQEVLNMDYVLAPEYSSIFQETSVSPEIIFHINFSNDQEAYNGMADWALPKGRFEVAAWDDIDKTASVYDAFEADDLRRDSSVISSGSDYYCNKYNDMLTDKDNVIVFRLAEMYMIRAEALNEIAYVADGDAFIMLNAIRTRAGLPELTSAELTNQEVFRLAVEDERRLEFAFEGHRYFDLKRSNRINEVLADIGTLKEADWLFPIPQSELDTNEHPDMSQNPGY